MTQKVFEKCKKHFEEKEITEIKLYETWNDCYNKSLRNNVKIIEINQDEVTVEYGIYTGKRKVNLTLVKLIGKCQLATEPIFDRLTINLHRKDIEYIYFKNYV